MRARWWGLLTAVLAILGGVGITTGAAGAAVPVRGTFTPLDPVRVLDTRDGTGVAEQRPGPFGVGQVTTLQIAGAGGVPVTGAGAVVLNVTATGAPGRGYITTYPCDEPRPYASNLNFTQGINVANLVTAKVSRAGAVCFFANRGVQIVADVSGWYADDFAAVPGFHYHELDPARVLDTRAGTGLAGRPAGPLPAGEVLAVDIGGAGGVPGDGSVRAVTLNVAATDVAGTGYATVFPCDRPRPGSSNVNFDPSTPAVSNLVTVRVPSDGRVCFVASSAIDLVADVQGYFSPAPGVDLVPIEPVRVLDTRDGTGVVDARPGPIGHGSVFFLHVTGAGGVPDDTRAVLLNVTVTEAEGRGFVTVFPCGRPRPLASNINFVAGVDQANLVKARVGAGGNICFFALTGTQIVADLNGYYIPSD